MKQIVRECIAEFFGTFILVLFGCSAGATTVLQDKVGGGTFQNPDEYMSITIGWALGIYFGILACIQVSGGHINPAVTLTMAVFERFPWAKVPFFLSSQLFGAFVGAVVVFINNWDSLKQFGKKIGLQHYYIVPERDADNSGATAGIFATFPQNYISNHQAFADQCVGTGIFLAMIFAVTDKGNWKNMKTSHIPKHLALSVLAIATSMGSNTGAPLNPARDLGPRIFCLFLYGGQSFSNYNYYFWIPILAPIIGGICGASLYTILIAWQNPDTDDRQEDQELDIQQKLININ